MLDIKTYISNNLSNLDHVTSKKEEFLSINDPLASKAAQMILQHNEQDYLEGCITATYKSDIIFTKEFETTDLLLTWQSMITPLLINEIDPYFEIVFLDSLIHVECSEKDHCYTIKVKDSYGIFDETVNKVIAMPKEDYVKGVVNEFLSFADFCTDNDLLFCEESSYSSFMLDVQKLKTKMSSM